ncbi:hypothetical protein V8C44DRAFT_333927 [Trichoderma aethiopicum]
MWWDLDAEIDPSSVPKRILRLRAVGRRNYASLLLECCVACCTLVADTVRCLPNLRAEEIMSSVVVQRDLGRDRPKSSAYSSLAASRFFHLLSSPHRRLAGLVSSVMDIALSKQNLVCMVLIPCSTPSLLC